jgi:hypothetical protein
VQQFDAGRVGILQVVDDHGAQAALDRRVTSGRRAAIPADIIVRGERSSRGEGS